MAISYVGGATNVSAGNTDVSVSLTALTGGSDSVPSIGDLILFAYNIADADNVDLNLACNTTDFAEIADLFGNGTQDANLGVFWKLANGETAVVGEGSLGGTDTAIQGVVMVFRGVNTTTPFDVTSTTDQGTTGGLPNPPSIDWSTAGAWTVIVGSNAHGSNTNGAFTAPTGYTTDFLTVGNQDTADGVIGMGYNPSPADPENPGAFADNVTGTGWCAVTIALRPSLDFSADLTAASFVFAAQSLAQLQDWIGQLTSATFSFASQALTQLQDWVGTLSTPTFSFTALDLAWDVATGFVVELSTATFSFAAQALSRFNDYILELSSATFSFVAQGLVWLQDWVGSLTSALFKFAAQDFGYTAASDAVIIFYLHGCSVCRRLWYRIYGPGSYF